MARVIKRQTHPGNMDSRHVKQLYYCNLFLPFLDYMITEVKEQLIEPRPSLLAQYLISSRLEQLPKGIEESDLFSAYASDCVYDERDVKLWRRNWLDMPVKERPRTACDTQCATLKESYPIIYTALTILATMPVSATTAERSFSLLKSLNTWLRNTMMQDRLTGLAFMNFHHKIPVDTDQVPCDFDSVNDRRILLAFN